MSSVTFDGQGPKLSIEVSSVPPWPLFNSPQIAENFSNHVTFTEHQLQHTCKTQHSNSPPFFRETGFFPRCRLNKTQQIPSEGSTFSSSVQVFQKSSQTSTKPRLLHIAAARDGQNSKNYIGSFRLVSTGLKSSCICSLYSIVQVRFGLSA